MIFPAIIKIFFFGGGTVLQLFLHLAKMARQFLVLPASSACSERLFSSAGKMHDDLIKNTSKGTMESQLIVCLNYPSA